MLLGFILFVKIGNFAPVFQNEAYSTFSDGQKQMPYNDNPFHAQAHIFSSPPFPGSHHVLV